MKKGFDNQKYLETQSKKIMERINSFQGKLYLEFGGKLFDDFHASRVLPGFEPDSKLQMLLQLADQAEIIIAISAKDIEENKIRGDLQIPYDEDVLRLIREFQNKGLYVSSVVITHYNGQKSAERLKKKLARQNIKTYHHYYIEGYPTDTQKIISPKGFGKNDFIQTSRPLVIVTAPGPGSGKMATCLSQLYHENLRGVQAGYAKFETFPIWSIPLNHPVNIAYEAATADLNDKNMIDPYHMDAYGEVAVNYNRDIEIFPVLRNMFEEINGTSPYQSPTDMGVNMAGFCISDDEVCQEASRQEIIRRYFDTHTRVIKEECPVEELRIQEALMKKAGVKPEDRACVKAAREKEAKRHVYCGAMEMEDGTIITSANTDFMGPCAALVMNAAKYLADVDDSIHLIRPEAFKPIQNLKTQYLKANNPRLHTDEVLIALSLSAQQNPLAKKTLEQLRNLKGLQAHVTCALSPVDQNAFNLLGIHVTCEAEKI
ncbi:DUF1846 domain-containing protein [Ileibacterium valens]|uniref:Uncharacterized protein n=1 Tax=Ileibacterium valens TaxID=1862668 RepID=A0A1U7NH80_9FIRM|nr:DUF1846 domain-containing protein [Ileibacterium valens]OLU36356.1 hypothetical protein BM735_12460 [Erysipelotrichaceae bacterium NYU-BL-F16]OLU40158.1 hypothetical protein BO224_06105 [Erysipelotrichaceae bacterium NYU-BL-E8]OLU40902.1 hypothetical protein BO222_04135 [Ileibacterium valens]